MSKGIQYFQPYLRRTKATPKPDKQTFFRLSLFHNDTPEEVYGYAPLFHPES